MIQDEATTPTTSQEVAPEVIQVESTVVKTAEVKRGICTYFSQPRGCIKGDTCDFQHVHQVVTAAPSSGKRICDFYLTERGCIKGDGCDFDHPKAPNGTVTTRVCEYFQNPKGCVKATSCDFLHIESKKGASGPMGRVAPGLKQCEWFARPGGCNKGNACAFAHASGPQGNMPRMQGYPGNQMPLVYNVDPYAQMNQMGQFMGGQMGGFMGGQMGGTMGGQMGGMMGGNPQMMGGNPQMMRSPGRGGGYGAIRPKVRVCEFFGQPRGCIKGDTCDFKHMNNAPCRWFNSPRGCRKGETCDFTHVSEGKSSARATPY